MSTSVVVAEGTDDRIAEIMRHPDAMDAIEWLAQGTVDDPRHLRPESSTTESIAYVRDILSNGAVAVLASPYPEPAPSPYRLALVIELPTDPSTRRRLFAWLASDTERSHGVPEVDSGQSHILHLAIPAVDEIDSDDEYDPE